MKQKPIIPNLTVICVAGNRQAESVASLYRAKAQIDAAGFVLLTNINLTASGIEIINVGGLDTWEKYNDFVIKELYKYFDTEYCLIVQWDGIIDDGELWSDDFLKFDYIGASWLNGECGNGGFSIRSHRLMKIVAEDNFIEITAPEDNCLCILYRKYLETKYSITYADKETCDKFSFELNTPLQPTFGHHAFHHAKYKPTVVIKRTHAMGDVIMCEPVMHYFWKKGYNVVLDTLEPYYLLFKQHYFPVYSVSQIPAKYPVREIDLNMAYECFPKQNHLKSYYQFAEIEGGEMRNPLLRFESAFKNKLFKKYAVIHIDERPEPYRNVYGIDWEDVALRLKEKGYDVIQVGAGKHYKIKNAIEINTSTDGMLMYVVGGADLFVGIDAGVAHIASAFQVPSILFFGSVNPSIIYPDLTGKICIHNHHQESVMGAKHEPICNQPFCWHNSVTTTGQDCYVNKEKPPCTQYVHQQILNAIYTIA